MAKKKGKAALDAIANAGVIPDWAFTEAKNHIDQNYDRFNFQNEPARKYYVIYSLRGPAARNRKCGIYSKWRGDGGAEDEAAGCTNNNTTASTFQIAQALLLQGIAMQFRDGHLRSALAQPQSTPSEHAGPSRRPRQSGDESEDEDMSRKRPRLQEQLGASDGLHAGGSQSNVASDYHDDFIPVGDAEQGAEPEQPAPEFPLCPEQQHALDLALKGHNLFITGSGGCGKSVLVKALQKNFEALNKVVHLLAPTGQAATNIGGRTTFSYASWQPQSLAKTNKTLIGEAHRTSIRNRLCETNVLIIDEISMVERQFFERLSCVLSAIREDTRPFGGVQIITVGDFCQLGPIRPFEYCFEEKQYISNGQISIPCGKREKVRGKYTCGQAGHPTFTEREKYAFTSPVWRECNFRYIHLTRIHRQKDEMFVGILQNIRMGHGNDEDLNILLQKRDVDDGVVLFPKKDQVKEHNDAELDKLKHKEHRYDSINIDNSGDDDQRFAKTLVLKKTMPVVLLSNVDVENGFCNGSQGRIVGWAPLKPENEPKHPEEKNYNGDKVAFDVAVKKFYEVTKFTRKHDLFPVVKFFKGDTRVIRPDCSVFNIETRVTTLNSRSTVELASCSTRTQIPLAPGWAMTIHKSQSLSLDRLTVDLNNVWDGRQTYVGLSRARSLEGLKVRGSKELLKTKLRLDPVVKAFMEKVAKQAREDVSE